MAKIRLNVRQLASGQWAAFSGAAYWTSTVADTEKEARIKRLQDIGRDAQETIDSVDKELEKLGALDTKDPHGYLC